jgi:hypothetical protein
MDEHVEGAPELPGSPESPQDDANGLESIAVDDTDPGPHSNGNGRAPPTHQVSNISMPIKKSGLLSTSSNLVNSIVGAGIIGIPYAMRQSGIVVGLILIVLVAYLTDKSLRIIIEVACFHPKLKHLGVLTYGTRLKCSKIVKDRNKDTPSGGLVRSLENAMPFSQKYLSFASNSFSQRISCRFPLVAMVAILF